MAPRSQDRPSTTAGYTIPELLHGTARRLGDFAVDPENLIHLLVLSIRQRREWQVAVGRRLEGEE
jgi:hypothetical protein